MNFASNLIKPAKPQLIPHEQPTTPSGKPIPPRKRKIATTRLEICGQEQILLPYIEHTSPRLSNWMEGHFHLELLDTAGHDEFTILDSRQAIGLDGWALVYSINSRSSFDMVSIIRDKILGFIGQDHVPMVLMGQALARSWNCGFTEASARSGENVLKIFLLALIEVERDLNPDEEISQLNKSNINNKSSNSDGSNPKVTPNDRIS
ncbi:ras family protein, partial [Phakopsora pachyrhizi]